MKPLSQKQKEKIKKEFYKQWKTCENDLTVEKDSKHVSDYSQPLIFVLHRIIQNTLLEKEINYQPHRDYHELLEQLQLTCSSCGKPLKSKSRVGKYVVSDEFWRSFSYI